MYFTSLFSDFVSAQADYSFCWHTAKTWAAKLFLSVWGLRTRGAWQSETKVHFVSGWDSWTIDWFIQTGVLLSPTLSNFSHLSPASFKARSLNASDVGLKSEKKKEVWISEQFWDVSHWAPPSAAPVRLTAEDAVLTTVQLLFFLSGDTGSRERLNLNKR